MKTQISYLAIVLFLSTLTSCASMREERRPNADTTPKKLQIIALTDLHGALEPQGEDDSPLQWGGAAILSTYIHLIQSESKIPTVIIDAGDQYQGTLVSNSARGEPVVRFYNYLHVDAVAIGNHDFDYGTGGKIPVPTQPGDDPRGALKARKKQANYPFLAANIRNKADSSIPEWAQPSVMLHPQGSEIKVGVIGIATRMTPETTMSENVDDLDFIDITQHPEIVGNEATKLRADGADYVILTIHSGGGCKDNTQAKITDLSTCTVADEITKLIPQLPAHTLDFIVAGHTHQPMMKVISGVPVVQPVANSSHVGWAILDKAQDNPLVKLDLIPTCQTFIGNATTCDPHQSGKIIGTSSPATFLGHPVTPDPAVNDLLKDDFARVDKIEEAPLGISATGDFTRDYKGENSLGNMLTDTLLAHFPDMDVALINNGGLRADIYQGDLTYGDVFDVSPFDNRLAVISASGDQFSKIVAHGVAGFGGAYSWSHNVTFTAANCKLLDVKINGVPPDPQKTYTIVTQDFLATSGFVTAMAKNGVTVKMMNDRQLFRDEWADALKAWKKNLDPGQFFDKANKRQAIQAVCPEQQ